MQRTGIPKTGAWMIVVTIAAAEMLAGCRAESSKDGVGERLKVSSPFGGLQVKVMTDEDAAGSGPGVPI